MSQIPVNEPVILENKELKGMHWKIKVWSEFCSVLYITRDKIQVLLCDLFMFLFLNSSNNPIFFSFYDSDAYV